MSMIKLKLNQALRGHPIGCIISVEVDSEGTALDRYWRRRIKDAKFDNCLEIIEPSKPKRGKSK